MSRRRAAIGRRAKPMVGQYIGWDGSADLTAWENANSISIPLSHEFGDQTAWDWFETGTNFENWSPWVTAKAGRRFSYSCPLLTVEDSGSSQSAKYSSLAAGSFDSHFTTLGQTFQSFPALRNSIVRLGWEFNGNSRAWAVEPGNQTQLNNFKTGFNRAAAALKAACPTLLIEWCPNVQLDYTQRTFVDMYPGNTYIDIIGIGAYDYYWPGGSPSHETVWAWLRDGETGVNGLKDQVSLARANNKLLGHTEWGLWSGSSTYGEGDSPAFIDKIADWYEMNGYMYHVYNNVNADAIHLLDDYPNAKARYLARFRR